MGLPTHGEESRLTVISSEELHEEAGVPTRSLSAGFDAPIGCVGTYEVEPEASGDAHILGSMTGAANCFLLNFSTTGGGVPRPSPARSTCSATARAILTRWRTRMRAAATGDTDIAGVVDYPFPNAPTSGVATFGSGTGAAYPCQKDDLGRRPSLPIRTKSICYYVTSPGRDWTVARHGGSINIKSRADVSR